MHFCNCKLQQGKYFYLLELLFFYPTDHGDLPNWNDMTAGSFWK